MEFSTFEHNGLGLVETPKNVRIGNAGWFFQWGGPITATGWNHNIMRPYLEMTNASVFHELTLAWNMLSKCFAFRKHTGMLILILRLNCFARDLKQITWGCDHYFSVNFCQTLYPTYIEHKLQHCLECGHDDTLKHQPHLYFRSLSLRSFPM